MNTKNDFGKFLSDKASSGVLLSGGIGNQLFQYCFARELQDSIGDNVFLDFSLIALTNRAENQIPSIRSLSISKLISINRTALYNSLLSFSLSHYSKKQKRIYLEKVMELQELYGLTLWRQSSQIYDNTINFHTKSFYIGSFASMQYWGSSYGLRVSEVQTMLNQFAIQKHRAKECRYDIVIHARRGDYASNTKTRIIHGVYGIDYYLHALTFVKEINNRQVTVLSDDSQFAKLLCFAIQRRFKGCEVDVSRESNPLLALFQYSNSQLFIGSNSTFSWWLASLGREKLRMMPNKWFNHGNFGFNAKYFFPDNTQLIRFKFEDK